jgi:thiamine-phosphate pyrophosphorylase
VIGVRAPAMPRLVLITDPAFTDDQILRAVHAVADRLPRGAFAVQLRDRRRARVSLRLFASRLRIATRAVGASLLVNGDVSVARDVGAEGAHLGYGACSVAEARDRMGARAWISVATHSDENVRRAAAQSADAVLVGPVFPSHSPFRFDAVKRARGLRAVRSALEAAQGKVAVYALGGVTADTVQACVAAGADGVALIRAWLQGAEPGREVRAIHDSFALR